MSWMKKIFGGHAATVDSGSREKALVLAVRQKLSPYRKGIRGAEELFVPVTQFLTALEMRAAASPTMRLLGRPETVKASARIALQAEVLKGNMPFFYKADGDNEALVSAVSLRARDLADHAAWLIDRGQVTLAGVYAQALDDLDEDMQTYAALTNVAGLFYDDGKDLGRTFEVESDDDRDFTASPVLTHKKSMFRPS